ncbi:MAG: FAD:protein FMN transferase [Prevotella sp.]|nr:FAD:protein FMN transferase [Prevotella sp.]
MNTNRNKRLLWQIPFLVLLIVGTVLIIRQQQSIPYQKCTGTIFGTTYHITYQYDDDLQAELEGRMKEVDNALSMFNKESIISRINNNQPVELNAMFLEVFRLAQDISKDTEGAFDITVAPLVNAWGFGFKHEQMPDKHAVDSLKSIIGYQKVSYDGKRIKKSDPRIMLDCSAIAKGYGVDAVASLLDEKGISNYMVEIGGEVVTHGISEKRIPWKIGVTKPTDDPLMEGSELQTVLNLTDKAMATSGNYRNFYYKGKRKYAHTINPKTGYPVQHNILSATVLTNRCVRADAYATAFMVMGFDGAKKVLERNPDLMAYIIYDDNGQNKVWFSPSLKDKIEK